MSLRFVQHDGYRWKVVMECFIDDAPAYELVRRVPAQRAPVRVFARVSECQPDAHEPVRVFRNADAVIRFNTKRGIVSVSAPRARRKFTTTLLGILQMCARAEAARKARDRAFKRRTGRR